MRLAHPSVRALPLLCALVLALSCASHRQQPLDNAPPTRFLTCSPVVEITATGGRPARLPEHELQIPQNALPAGARVRLHRLGADPAGRDTIGVRVEVIGGPATFDRPATILIDARQCTSAELGSHTWRIWQQPHGADGFWLITDKPGGRFRSREVTRNSTFMIAN
jgi:hypothetical protein